MEVAGRFVGIDLGKRTYEMCIVDQKGKITRTGGKTDFAGIDRLCEKLNGDDAGRLAVIYMSTRKTDKEDSLKLAKLLKNHDEDELPIVTPPSDEEWERRKLLSEYRSLKCQRTKEINKLHAIFEHNGYTQFVRKDMCSEKNRANILPLLKGYEKEEAERLTLLEKQIEQLLQKINAEVESDAKIQKVMTVPGIGPITALAYVAYVGDVKRFDNAHQVSNFIGFVPKVDNSCTICRSGHTTKKGNPLLRSLLVQAAWATVKSKNGGALREKYKYMAESRCIGK